jgi:DNA-directed RNA polymerase specialized sigma24 family protein
MSEPTETAWIVQLKSGGEQAADRLWEQYFLRLVGLARMKLAGVRGSETAAEDVALSAFKSLCLGARRGNFPDLKNRDNLWPLLLVITSRKVGKLKAHEGRQKRGGGKVQADTDLARDDQLSPLAEILSHEPTPEFSVVMAEECERLLDMLDADLRELAIAKMDGFTNKEIATQRSVAPRTIERKLQLIRRVWEDAAARLNEP